MYYSNSLVMQQHNYDAKAHKYESTNKPSMTVPDQTLTVRQILDRYARGLSADVATYDDYDVDDESYVPDPRTLDLVDRQRMKELYEAELADLREKQASARSKAKRSVAEHHAPSPAPKDGLPNEAADDLK